MGLVVVKPVIGATSLTCVTTIGSQTITSAAQFGSVVAGMSVRGAGVPNDSVVDAVASTSSLTIRNSETNEPAAMLATSGGVALQFGYFTALAYSDGDTLGFPMRVPIRLIRNITVVDVSKQITKLKLYFFLKPFTSVADNVAWAPSAADLKNLVAIVLVDQLVAETNANVITMLPTTLPLDLGGKDTIHVQAVVEGNTPTFSAVDNVAISFGGE